MLIVCSQLFWNAQWPIILFSCVIRLCLYGPRVCNKCILIIINELHVIKSLTKTTVLLRLERCTAIILIVTFWLSVILYSGSNVPQ